MKHKTLFFSSMALLVLTAIYIYAMTHPRELHYGPELYAEKLSAKPEKFIVLAEPDSYLLEALSNPETEVFIGSWENTNIDELVRTYETFDVEYNGTYYTVHLLTDGPVYGGWFLILLFSWIGLGLSFVIMILRHRKNYGFFGRGF